MRTDDEIEALRQGCTRSLQGAGVRRPAEQLAAIPRDTAPDCYGQGGAVAELEAETASLLGKPAAVFLPSGTMAQQITLRVHADRLGRRTVLFHPMCHLEQHEGRGFERLHDLVGRPVGDARRLLTLEDLEAVGEQPATLVLELPQRDLGGQLPGWDDLQAQVAWARERGAAVHLDGARLWECGPAYERSVADIAALFDTVYVSFYKKLGGLSGCCVAGPAEVMAEVREWRARHGGAVFALWPPPGTRAPRPAQPPVPDLFSFPTRFPLSSSLESLEREADWPRYELLRRNACTHRCEIVLIDHRIVRRRPERALHRVLRLIESGEPG